MQNSDKLYKFRRLWNPRKYCNWQWKFWVWSSQGISEQSEEGSQYFRQEELSEMHALSSQVLENLKAIDSFIKAIDSSIKFLFSVKSGQFPLDNVAFNLFLDVARWYAGDDSRTMRYSDTTLKFFWHSKRIFRGRLVWLMSGLKNDTDFLMGKQHLSWKFQNKLCLSKW